MHIKVSFLFLAILCTTRILYSVEKQIRNSREDIDREFLTVCLKLPQLVIT